VAFRRPPPAAQRMKMQSQKLRLLAVAASLATFTREQLAVEAWKRYPADFCLTGFPEYPDVTKVRQAMSAGKGLSRSAAWLRCRPMYTRSRRGAGKLAGPSPERLSSRPGLTWPAFFSYAAVDCPFFAAHV
jgi:hypothetical protein